MDRLWEMESDKLMEELVVTMEDLDPKPADAESKKTGLKDLKEKREQEGARLEEEVERLWKMFEVGKDDQKAFKEKVEAAGKLKQAWLTLLKDEADKLWEMESEKLMEELGVTVEDLETKPTDSESKNMMLRDLHWNLQLEKELEGF